MPLPYPLFVFTDTKKLEFPNYRTNKNPLNEFIIGEETVTWNLTLSKKMFYNGYLNSVKKVLLVTEYPVNRSENLQLFANMLTQKKYCEKVQTSLLLTLKKLL